MNEKEYMTKSLSPNAKAHLVNIIFDPEEGLGSLELPDNPAIADELRAWLADFGAEPYLVRVDTSFHDESEEGQEIDLLEQFVIEPDSLKVAVNSSFVNHQTIKAHILPVHAVDRMLELHCIGKVRFKGGYVFGK